MPVDRTEGTPPDKHQDQSSRRNWPPKDPPMFWITFVTFVAVAAYTILTGVQLRDARHTYIAQNRPYLSFTGFTPIPTVDKDGTVRVVDLGPQFSNFGNTPAVNTVVRICQPLVRDTVASPNLTCVEQDRPDPGIVFGPRQQHTAKGAPVTVGDLEGTASGTKFIYAFGEIDYDDIIGGEGHYRTRFCNEIILNRPHLSGASSQTQSAPPPSFLEGACRDASWNCVDGNCPVP